MKGIAVEKVSEAWSIGEEGPRERIAGERTIGESSAGERSAGKGIAEERSSGEGMCWREEC